MSRLTKKIEDLDFYKISSAYIDEIPNQFLDKDYVGEAINKLGKLEDLEEKYDLPLDVLVTLLDHYYYYDEDGNQKFLHSLDMYHKQIVIKKYENDDDIYGYYEHLNFKDYKKTWWINADKTF